MIPGFGPTAAASGVQSEEQYLGKVEKLMGGKRWIAATVSKSQ